MREKSFSDLHHLEPTVTHIRPAKGARINFRELIEYKELFYFFTWRDFKVKYRQTFLGITWAILQPVLLMILFTVIFRNYFRQEIGNNVPYPLFILSGLIVWTLFQGAVSHAAESMVSNSNIIKKMYFPRLIIPASAVLGTLIDFIISFLVFAGFCIYYQHDIHSMVWWCWPLAILLTLIAAFGTGTLLSALNLKYRDFRYVLPFLLQLLFFGSQIIYPIHILNPDLTIWLALNPLNAVAELMHAPLLGQAPDWKIVLPGIATTLLITFIGLYYFRRTEAYFADIA